jgi:hypothetical protein
MAGRTLVDFKVGDGLPLVHGDEPRVALPPTAQINHQPALVAVELLQDLS